MVRFIHAADLHLDSPFKGLRNLPEKLFNEVQQSTFTSLKNIVHIAIEEKVDFVLFAGDIFDIEDRSVKAQIQFKREMENLNNNDISVYVIHGNHDSLAERSAFLKLPDNVFTFGSDVETEQLLTSDKEKISITGFSYGKRHQYERMIHKFPQKNIDSDFHIGILHGSQEGIASAHGMYAPFSIKDLRILHYDYFALGHIHKRQKIHSSLPAYYSGNTQGLHRNEPGSKGCFLVEEIDNELVPKYIETSPIKWENIEVEINESSNLNDILTVIQKKVDSFKKEKILATFKLKLTKDTPNSVINKLTIEELNSVFSRLETDHIFWISKIKIEFIENEYETSSLQKLFPKAWNKTIDEVMKEESFEELYEELYKQIPPEYLSDMHSKEYRKNITKEAVERLKQLMNT